MFLRNGLKAWLLLVLPFAPHAIVMAAGIPLHCRPQESMEVCSQRCEELYGKQRDRFWKLSQVSFAAASKCATVRDMKEFLETIPCGGGEPSAAHTENMLSLAQDKTTCFLDALLVTQDRYRIMILEQLKDPMYGYAETLPSVLIRFKKNPKYNQLLSPIGDARK